MTTNAKNLPVNPPAEIPSTDTETPMSDLEMLKALMAKFSKADIVKLTKEVAADKQTILSVTMDAIVAANGVYVSATINDEATRIGTECGVFANGDKASPVSTAQLIRHVQAYEAAIKRAVDKVPVATDTDTELDVSKLNAGEPSYTEQPAS